MDYRVDLEIYSGPLDLLLYLIKKNELDIYDIPIAKITEQYLSHLDLLRDLDITIAGEFLVTAATLMLIKSRMLLPKEEISLDEEEEDPRLTLVRQLMDYKRFKDAASDLYERGEEQAMKYPPAMRACVAQEDDDGRLLQEVDLWDLISAFKRVLAETGADISTTIIRDDIPIQVYIKRLLERLTEGKYLSFFDMFKEDGDRINIIGTFLAVLELTRMGRILVEQNQLFGDIYLRLWEKEAA